jgi:hypothetical protein
MPFGFNNTQFAGWPILMKLPGCDYSEMELACIPLEMLLPQLAGLIQEHVTFFLNNRTSPLRDMPFATT